VKESYTGKYLKAVLARKGRVVAKAGGVVKVGAAKTSVARASGNGGGGSKREAAE
jgi:hypothetical protein